MANEDIEREIRKIEVRFGGIGDSYLNRASDIERDFMFADRIGKNTIEELEKLKALFTNYNEWRKIVIDKNEAKLIVYKNLLDKKDCVSSIASYKREIAHDKKVISYIDDLIRILYRVDNERFCDIICLFSEIDDILFDMSGDTKSMESDLRNAKHRYEYDELKDASDKDSRDIINYIKKNAFTFIYEHLGLERLLDKARYEAIPSGKKSEYNGKFKIDKKAILKNDVFYNILEKKPEYIESITGIKIDQYKDFLLDLYRINKINNIIKTLLPLLGKEYEKIRNIIGNLQSKLDKRYTLLSNQIKKMIEKYEKVTGKKINEEEKEVEEKKTPSIEPVPEYVIRRNRELDMQDKMYYLADMLFRLETNMVPFEEIENLKAMCKKYKAEMNEEQLAKVEAEKDRLVKNEMDSRKELMNKKSKLVEDEEKELEAMGKLEMEVQVKFGGSEMKRIYRVAQAYALRDYPDRQQTMTTKLYMKFLQDKLDGIEVSMPEKEKSNEELKEETGNKKKLSSKIIAKFDLDKPKNEKPENKEAEENKKVEKKPVVKPTKVEEPRKITQSQIEHMSEIMEYVQVLIDIEVMGEHREAEAKKYETTLDEDCIRLAHMIKDVKLGKTRK